MKRYNPEGIYQIGTHLGTLRKLTKRGATSLFFPEEQDRLELSAKVGPALAVLKYLLEHPFISMSPNTVSSLKELKNMVSSIAFKEDGTMKEPEYFSIKVSGSEIEAIEKNIRSLRSFYAQIV